MSDTRTAAQRFEALLQRRQKSAEYWSGKLCGQVADIIFDAMQERKMSKAELARQLGVSRAYVTKMLRGDANLTLDSLARIARVLNCNVSVSFEHKEGAK